MSALDVARRLAAVAVAVALSSPAWAADPVATGSKDAAATAPSTKKKARRDPGVNQPGAAGNRGVAGAPAGTGRDPGVNQPGAAGNRGATPGAAGNVGPGR